MRTTAVPQATLDNLERELGRPEPHTGPGWIAARPPIHPESAVQIIAQGIINLSWKEAEKMGEGIKAKMKDGESLTSAIQAWASEWEQFK